jgi:hypothetical protein
MGDFNYGDYFGHDWNSVKKFNVEFVDSAGVTRGHMSLEASDATVALNDAADFQQRFALFPQYGNRPLRPLIR